MNNVDATVKKDAYGNLLECIPPVTLEEYNRQRASRWRAVWRGAIGSDRVLRNRGDK